MHFRGLAAATVNVGALAVVLSFAPGLRMSSSGFAAEEAFAVGTNPTGAGEKAGMVMYEVSAGTPHTIACREAVNANGWIGLAGISFLAEA
jgi:hypothetical protein